MTISFQAILIVMWWYASVATVFEAVRSEVLISDAMISVRTVWEALRPFDKWLISTGQYAAELGDRLSNETAEVIVHWLLQIVVIGGLAGGTGALLFMFCRKMIKVYRENCLDLVSAVVTVTSVVVIVYFGDWFKTVVKMNLMVLLLLVQAVYVAIRTYVNGCKRARRYY